MISITKIPKGREIFNTYGDLPNADLLRKYGFAEEGNPFDVVEIDSQLVVEICSGTSKDPQRVVDVLEEMGLLEE
jgi:SET domain-containing protein 6